jgi:peptidoglycan hydrolase CwlO-like protein
MSKLTLYIAAGVIGFGVLSGLYYKWRKDIEREALYEYNQKQIEQNQKDQEFLRQQLENIVKKQKEVEEANAADKKEFKGKMDSITSDIESKETVDRAASDVLKKTVTKLKDAPK